MDRRSCHISQMYTSTDGLCLCPSILRQLALHLFDMPVHAEIYLILLRLIWGMISLKEKYV